VAAQFPKKPLGRDLVNGVLKILAGSIDCLILWHAPWSKEGFGKRCFLVEQPYPICSTELFISLLILFLTVSTYLAVLRSEATAV